ncbi:AAA family ATPase ['Camptotheca acuminata' phytoplasma]|uniref:AAA family ATPase n=1 Tax='Camptotheca acuminata' phytoplasma TaxID=3239192 RepID=UPI00351AB066
MFIIVLITVFSLFLISNNNFKKLNEELINISSQKNSQSNKDIEFNIDEKVLKEIEKRFQVKQLVEQEINKRNLKPQENTNTNGTSQSSSSEPSPKFVLPGFEEDEYSEQFEAVYPPKPGLANKDNDTKWKKYPFFKQMVGLQSEKNNLKPIIKFVNNKENYQGIGKVEPPEGALFYGTPGTGKTVLAQAFAKECNLPFFEVSSSVFSQKFKGNGVRMVEALFKKARFVADKYNGCIVFLDECEEIFRDLGTLEGGSDIANVVNQFKIELTSTENNIEKPVLLLAATNYEDKIEEAIKSRFTYRIEFHAGDQETRNEQFLFMVKQRKNPFSDEAKRYFKEVINPALNNFNGKQEYKKAYRTLLNLVKATVTVFADNRDPKDKSQQQIQPAHLKTSFYQTISQNLSKVNELEKETGFDNLQMIQKKTEEDPDYS